MKFKYLVYTGSAEQFNLVKTACGVVEWRPESCVGQMRDSEDCYNLPIPDMTMREAAGLGANAFLIGVAPRDAGSFDADKIALITEATKHFDYVLSGTHSKMVDVPELVEVAKQNNCELIDFRHRDMTFPKGKGLKRKGKRLLTVGTDCTCGKKFTSLCIDSALTQRSRYVTFRSTGQTGYLISGGGINNDTIVADFLSGAAEWLSPDNRSSHLDIIEGQGSLRHPSYSGGSLSLLHGSQPDYLVMCHDPVRATMSGVHRIPDLDEDIHLNLTMAKVANPDVKLVGISLFSRDMTNLAYQALRDKLSEKYGVPVFDPYEDSYHFHKFIDILSKEVWGE